MSLRELMQTGLPLNRKERFYTATVFPMLVCRENFRYFNRFTALIVGYRDQPVDVTPDSTNIQFFTEYGLADSLFGAAANRFSDPHQEHDTPDILIYIRGTHTALIALEAKMFLAPAPSSLHRQMERQRLLLGWLQNSLAVDVVYHVALVPEQWKAALVTFEFPVMTWHDLYQQFAEIIPGDYFLEMLRLALNNYDDLVSQRSGGKNSEARMTGLSIFEQFTAGTLTMRIMGRQRGLQGGSLRQDIESGDWRTYRYETSTAADLPNQNWFYIEDFVALLNS